MVSTAWATAGVTQSFATLRPLPSLMGGAGHSLDIVATPTLFPRVGTGTTTRSTGSTFVASGTTTATTVVASRTVTTFTTVARGATARVIVPLSATCPTAGLFGEPTIIATTTFTARVFTPGERFIARGSGACFANRAIRNGRRRRRRGRYRRRLPCLATFAVEHEQRGCRHFHRVHFGQDWLDDGNPWQVRPREGHATDLVAQRIMRRPCIGECSGPRERCGAYGHLLKGGQARRPDNGHEFVSHGSCRREGFRGRHVVKYHSETEPTLWDSATDLDHVRMRTEYRRRLTRRGLGGVREGDEHC